VVQQEGLVILAQLITHLLGSWSFLTLLGTYLGEGQVWLLVWPVLGRLGLGFTRAAVFGKIKRRLIE
jgi:hypothetical protein